MLTLRRSAIEQICSRDEGVYLMYTTEERVQRCQWMTEAMVTDAFDALVAVNPLLRAGKPALGALAVNDGHARILTPTAFDAFTPLRK